MMNIKNHFSRGFTLIEIIIVITIIALLAIAVLSSINPIEQMNKGIDISLIHTSKSVITASDRYFSINEKIPWVGIVSTSLLSSEENIVALESLVNLGELKPSFLGGHSRNLNRIFFTRKDESETYSLCFIPKSKAYQIHQNTIFQQNGEFKEECMLDRANCYFCFGDFILGDVIAAATEDEEETDDEDISCDSIDPEYPDYPWTCNYSSKWSEYGCTNYCVIDLGCDGYCPEGQRHVQKTYHANGDDFIQCSSHIDETVESYCISDPYARCDIKTWRSYLSDYTWGCTNPRRPIEWIE